MVGDEKSLLKMGFSSFEVKDEKDPNIQKARVEIWTWKSISGRRNGT